MLIPMNEESDRALWEIRRAIKHYIDLRMGRRYPYIDHRQELLNDITHQFYEAVGEWQEEG